MKALSIRPDYADMIAAGEKKYEFRSWATSYRGDILIHANKNIPDAAKNMLVSGHAICIANLKDVKKRKNGYAWELTDLRYIEPIKVRGQQRLFNIDDNLINLIDITDYEDLLEYWDMLGLINLEEC